MDRFNYIAWVENACQKFEDVCLEVDNIMREEIIGVAENQLQSMGASVTRFFSDLVDDVIPQYSAVRVAEEVASDLSPVQKSGVVAHKKSESSMDDGHCEKEPSFGDNFHHLSHMSGIGRGHLDPHLKQNDDGTLREKSMMIVKGNPIKEKENQLESLDILEKDSVRMALSSTLDEDTESLDILEKKDSVTAASSPPLDNNTESLDIHQKKDSGTAALSLLSEISTENLDILEQKDIFMEAFSSSLDDNTESTFLIGEGEESLFSDPSTLIGSCGSEVLDIESALNVSAAESTGDSIDYVCNLELETIQPSNKAKLDENCIMVDISDLSAASIDVRRSWSDKEKLWLKSILASIKKVQDWDCDHSHLHRGWYQQNGKGLAVQDDGFSESEWEII